MHIHIWRGARNRPERFEDWVRGDGCNPWVGRSYVRDEGVNEVKDECGVQDNGGEKVG